VIEPPVATGVVGQAKVTAIRGLALMGQVIEVPLVVALPVQTSLPLAASAVEMEQVLAGTVKLPLKFADAPGASEEVVKTTVFGAGRSLTTTMLLNVILPPFLTVPL
jgi:hypothetical protein